MPGKEDAVSGLAEGILQCLDVFDHGPGPRLEVFLQSRVVTAQDAGRVTLRVYGVVLYVDDAQRRGLRFDRHRNTEALSRPLRHRTG